MTRKQNHSYHHLEAKNDSTVPRKGRVLHSLSSLFSPRKSSHASADENMAPGAAAGRSEDAPSNLATNQPPPRPVPLSEISGNRPSRIPVRSPSKRFPSLHSPFSGRRSQKLSKKSATQTCPSLRDAPKPNLDSVSTTSKHVNTPDAKVTRAALPDLHHGNVSASIPSDQQRPALSAADSEHSANVKSSAHANNSVSPRPQPNFSFPRPISIKKTVAPGQLTSSFTTPSRASSSQRPRRFSTFSSSTNNDNSFDDEAPLLRRSESRSASRRAASSSRHSHRWSTASILSASIALGGLAPALPIEETEIEKYALPPPHSPASRLSNQFQPHRLGSPTMETTGNLEFDSLESFMSEPRTNQNPSHEMRLTNSVCAGGVHRGQHRGYILIGPSQGNPSNLSYESRGDVGQPGSPSSDGTLGPAGVSSIYSEDATEMASSQKPNSSNLPVASVVRYPSGHIIGIGKQVPNRNLYESPFPLDGSQQASIKLEDPKPPAYHRHNHRLVYQSLSFQEWAGRVSGLRDKFLYEAHHQGGPKYADWNGHNHEELRHDVIHRIFSQLYVDCATEVARASLHVSFTSHLNTSGTMANFGHL